MRLSVEDLTKELVACRSVTPEDGGSLSIIKDKLQPLGFTCEFINRNQTKNLWATHGSGSPFFIFGGHVDVVPPGDKDWESEPFTPTVSDGFLYGRGTQDMKSSDAAFCCAAIDFVRSNPNHKGTVALLLTSDEEGDGYDGTVYVVNELQKRNLKPDFCIVGEPSCSKVLGDTIKNGRRGSLNGTLTVFGVQGHVAYPEKVVNPIHAVSPVLAELSSEKWDEGYKSFPPSSFQISNIHAGTGAVNVVPGECTVKFNIRFNPRHSFDSLKKRIEQICDKHKLNYKIEWKESARPFISEGRTLEESLTKAIEEVCSVAPKMSTSGGTSDARFISLWCPQTVEFGPVNDRIHQVNERIPLDELHKLYEVYLRNLELLFKEDK